MCYRGGGKKAGLPQQQHRSQQHLVGGEQPWGQNIQEHLQHTCGGQDREALLDQNRVARQHLLGDRGKDTEGIHLADHKDMVQEQLNGPF